MKNRRLGLWMAQIRAPFLLLAMLLVFIGLAFAYRNQEAGIAFHWVHALLLLLGVVSAHASVNLFNEFTDLKTHIDSFTPRTPFSGGSGIVSAGLLPAKKVKHAAYFTLMAALCIGIYFAIVSHWLIWVFITTGALAIVLYTPVLSHLLLGEFFSGLTLGTFVVLGSYTAMVANPQMAVADIFPPSVVWLSIPPGILTALLLLINEIPDMEADKQGGRFHLVIWLGRKGGACLYSIGMGINFGLLAYWSIGGGINHWFLITLIPLPLAVIASVTAIRHCHDVQRIIPALGLNVVTVLTTNLLIALAILFM